MQKIFLLIICILCLTGCNDNYDDIDDYEENYDLEENYDYSSETPSIDPWYNEPSERYLTVNDLNVSVNTFNLPNYSISVTSSGITNGSILFNVSCNYNYKIGTLTTIYSGYATASSYVYFNNNSFATATGYMPMQFNPFNISCSYTYNIMAGATVSN